MARIINTATVDPFSLRGFDRDQVYNALDVCVTSEVLPHMLGQLGNATAATYWFERSLQGPVLEMRLRGCLVDQARRADVTDEFWDLLDILERDLNRIVHEGVGLPSFNWRSTRDLQRLLYDELGLPMERRGGRPTVDEDARKALEVYPIARQIIWHLNAMAIIGKKISVLQSEIDDDGRIRTSYNIAGTSTGRFSSSLSEFGTGGNLQNVEESLRSILVADPGYKFAKFDAKSGESYCVGAIEWNLFRDPTFLDAVESGDVHTAVARLVWPGLGWTGELRHDKHLAERPFFRHYTYRFMCKKIGHGSNYLGGPDAIAIETKLPINIIVDFQPKYFGAFPAHQRWHRWVEETLKDVGHLTTLTGRRRYFFKRRNEPKTIKEAVAYDPQGSLADLVNTALLNIWRLGIATVMFQDHDAITFMYPERDEERVLPLLRANLIVPLELADGRMLRIPYDCEVGWNKGHYHEQANPNGLREYNGPDDRRRVPEASIMDRVVCRSDGKNRRAPDLSALGGDLDDSSGGDAEGLD